MAQALENLSFLGWKARGGVAFIVGALSLLAMPPFFCWTILFITMPVLVLLLDGAALKKKNRLKNAAFIGWCFGFGYFLMGFYWIYHAFLIESNKFGWLVPIIVPLLPAVLALFYALVCVLAVWFWRAGAARILALALSFGVVEWGRGHLFTGLPWHTFGYSLTASDSLMQSASLFGLYGLTILAVILFASPILLWHSDLSWVRSWLKDGVKDWRRFDIKAVRPDCKKYANGAEGRFFVGVMAVFALLWTWGSLRLWFEVDMQDKVAIRVVQPNVLQKNKWNPKKKQEIIGRFKSLTKEAVKDVKQKQGYKTLVIWPESAMPFLMLRKQKFLDEIAALLPENTFWITGNVRIEEKNGARVFYNSLLLLDDNGQWLDYFDKKHLIPFGEYMPFKSVLSLIGLQQLANAHGEFGVGTKTRYIAGNGIPAFAPLLCYEVIFPQEIIEKGARPEWLLNLTNDGWYGLSDGPFQHMHYSRVRSVEQGLPMVRAANTGISAIIDPYGRVVSQLSLGQAGVLRGRLPSKISPTLYARFGGWIFVLILVFAGLMYNNTKN